MSFTIIEAEQRSPAWHASRAGRVTGSVAGDMLAKIKNGDWSTSRRDLRLKLAIEQLTGLPSEEMDTWLGKDVQRGIDKEPVVADRYEADHGVLLQKTGFLQSNEFMAGCSLDGHVNDFEGIVEFKCPKTATHLSYLRSKKIPTDYIAQITHNLWISGAKWCDWCSFDDRLPEDLGLQFLCIRVPRDEAVMKAYEADVIRFLAEVKIEVQELTAMRAA